MYDNIRNSARPGFRIGSVALAARVLGLAAVMGLAGVAPAGAAGIEKDAKEILKSMSTHLGKLAAFSVDVDVDNEVLDLQGQKVHLTSSATLALQRPDRLAIVRRSGAGQVELIFDGKLVTIHGASHDAYVQFDSPGNIDQALQNTQLETGLDFPGADLLYTDSYDELMSGVVSGAYLGSGYVNGIECHHLAFRGEQVDWQIWVQTGDAPLPMKYVIITKWVTAAPQYSAQFGNWNTAPKFEAKKFDFEPGAGAKKLDQIPVGPTGELAVGGK